MTLATRRDYFETAMAQLGSSGFKGLTIASVTGALGVTSGSFYHHFGSWTGFVEALVEDWRAQQTARIITLVEGAGSDPAAQWDHLVRLAQDVPHEAEAAIRAWAGNDPVVAEAQRRVDRERIAFVDQLLGRLLGDRRRARALTSVVIAAYVGVELLEPELGSRGVRSALTMLRDLVLKEAS